MRCVCIDIVCLLTALPIRFHLQASKSPECRKPYDKILHFKTLHGLINFHVFRLGTLSAFLTNFSEFKILGQYNVPAISHVDGHTVTVEPLSRFHHFKRHFFVLLISLY